MLFDFSAKRKTKSDDVYTSSGFSLFKPPVAGIKVNEDSAFTYSAFYACMRIISETVAYIPWRVHTDDVKAPQSEHYLDRVLHKLPNYEMSSFIYKELALQHVLGWGNAYFEIERNRMNEVVALWPLQPSKTNPDRDNSGRLVYEYSNDNGQTTTLNSRDVFHVRGPSRDGIRGYSIIELAKESISLGLATESFGASFFGNGAFPGMVIKNTGQAKLADEGVENLLKTFNAKNQGPRNARRTQYLSPGLELEVVGIKPTDSQFLETRKFQIAEICRWFRIPPHKLADLERSTHTNIESQNIEFVTDSIMPWVSRLEQQANISLFKQSEMWKYYTKFNVMGLLRGDSKARSDYYKVLQAMGVLSIDEIREKEDYELLNDEIGGLRLVPVNMVTADRMVSGDYGAQTGSSASVEKTASELIEREAKRLVTIETKRLQALKDCNDDKLASLYVEMVSNAVDSFRLPAALLVGVDSNSEALESRIKSVIVSVYTNSANDYRASLETGTSQALLDSWSSNKYRKIVQSLAEGLRGLKNAS